jgi:hypothetical protein
MKSRAQNEMISLMSFIMGTQTTEVSGIAFLFPNNLQPFDPVGISVYWPTPQ